MGVEISRAYVKHLLAGANAVQICSALYRKKLGVVAQMLQGLDKWMQEHNFKAIGDFRGKLSRKASLKPEIYQRLQYIKNLVGIE